MLVLLSGRSWQKCVSKQNQSSNNSFYGTSLVYLSMTRRDFKDIKIAMRRSVFDQRYILVSKQHF